jgi:hypothetical protein
LNSKLQAGQEPCSPSKVPGVSYGDPSLSRSLSSSSLLARTGSPGYLPRPEYSPCNLRPLAWARLRPLGYALIILPYLLTLSPYTTLFTYITYAHSPFGDHCALRIPLSPLAYLSFPHLISGVKSVLCTKECTKCEVKVKHKTKNMLRLKFLQNSPCDNNYLLTGRGVDKNRIRQKNDTHHNQERVYIKGEQEVEKQKTKDQEARESHTAHK